MANVQVSRSYRRAALVLWPRERTVGTLAGGGVERAVAWFADDLARCEDETTTKRTEVRSTAGRQAPTYRVLARC